MRFLVLMMPEWGGFLPTLALAKELRSRGHDVLYAGLPLTGTEPMADFARFFDAEGFRFEELDLDPPPDYRPSPFSGGRAERAVRAVEEILMREGVALTLVDALVSYLAVAPAAHGVPVVALKATLLSTFNVEYPPFTSRLAGGAAEVGRVRVLASWLWRWVEVMVLPVLRRPLTAPFRYGWLGPRAYIRRAGRRQGFARRFTDYGPRLQVPEELYLCPAEWEIGEHPGRWYGGAAVDLARAEEVLEPDPHHPGTDLVICSLGTHSDRYPGSVRFFRTVVTAFARMPERGLVLHVGDGCDPRRLEPVPPNVRVARRIPQLALLSRAALMITHAGHGTVKECIAHGVPMLAYPAAYDQPGNAARLERHGLGRQGDYRRVTADEIVIQVESMMERRRDFLRNLERMRRAFIDPAPVRAAADRLERMARRPGTPERPPAGAAAAHDVDPAGQIQLLQWIVAGPG